MATLVSAWDVLDNEIKRYISHLRLNGKIIMFDSMREYAVHFNFNFTHKYLSINDCIKYDKYEIKGIEVFNEIVKHLNEIEFQFRYYFNAIWC